MVVKVKNMLGYDDSLDAFGVHGAGGTLGAILTGVFATKDINPAFKDAAGNALPVGLLEGNGGQVVNQIIGVGISWVLAIVATFIILKVVDAVVGLRVSPEEETMGLDLSQHGEEGYSLES
jgi:Amt family ammonium transporter